MNLTRFQFPSNGKAYPKEMARFLISNADLSFNSLQTGKHIQSEVDRIDRNQIIRFNSLQTGKHIQSEVDRIDRNQIIRFNSLQTGKQIQRQLEEKYSALLDTPSFNFPSNGKADTKGYLYSPIRPTNSDVSIPFKRESRYKVCA